MKKSQYLLLSMLMLVASGSKADGSCASGSMNECCINLENVTSFRLLSPPPEVCLRKKRNYVNKKILRNEDAEVLSI